MTQKITSQWALEAGYTYARQVDYANNYDGDCITYRHCVSQICSVMSVAAAVKDILTKIGILSTLQGHSYDTIFVEGKEAMVMVYDPERSFEGTPTIRSGRSITSYTEYSIFAQRLQTLQVDVQGSPEIVGKIVTLLNEDFKREKHAKIDWWYQSSHGPDTHTTFLAAPKTQLLKEFYPDMEMEPREYIQEYLDSEAAVLLMAGDPGTGKTTLLRHMIYEHQLGASVIYDDKLMKSDSIFQKFLFNGEQGILIIEDADTILSPRDTDNDLMSRFLNVSDGLIKLPNKKLVFTTNLSDFGKIDGALLRGGRCFDVLRTRSLTYNEAVAACNAAGIEIPTDRTRHYTLAELFNQGRGHKTRKIGFTG